MAKRKENRFKEILKEGNNATGGTKRVIVDTVTGVQYLTITHNESIAITPLLDGNGQVLIDVNDIKLQ